MGGSCRLGATESCCWIDAHRSDINTRAGCAVRFKCFRAAASEPKDLLTESICGLEESNAAEGVVHTLANLQHFCSLESSVCSAPKPSSHVDLHTTDIQVCSRRELRIINRSG